MIYFLTPTALPIEAATTMGVSVKGDGAIGKFGTGLKYAIAGVLRLNGTVSVTIQGEQFDFTAKDTDIRGKAFRVVHCNGQPCGFTTELGKHWQPWQLFRELASNALDEGGSWQRDPGHAVTAIAVNCREVEDAERTEQVFIGDKKVLVASTVGATIHEGPSQHYYFNGIRAGSFGGVAPVTVNVSHGSLSEDRLLDMHTVQSELAWAFRSATAWDESLLLSILSHSEPGSFWVENISAYPISGGDLPVDMMAFIEARPKFVNHPAFRKALDAHKRKGGAGRWTPVPMTPRQASLVADGEAVALAVGIDPIPRDRVRFTQDLADDHLAVTCMDTRDVWFSTKLAMLGRDEFVSGYLEEALHAMTGFRDCTREFQNALLAIIVNNAHPQRIAA